MLNGNKLLFLNEKAHHYRDIKISKENCVCNINAVLFLFFFWRGVILLKRDYFPWLCNVAGSFASHPCFTSLQGKFWQRLLTASSEGSADDMIPSSLMCLLRYLVASGMLNGWPPFLDGHPHFLASPNGISEHGGFLEIKPERRSKESVWTGWCHILL